MKNELKSCPICGGKADIIVGEMFMTRTYIIKCIDCGLHTDLSFVGGQSEYRNGTFRSVFVSDIEAVNKIKNKWNRRSIETH